MKIAVIMASCLGWYKGCASNRKEKFIRAVNSFVAQDYKDKILIVVSDGCQITKTTLQQSESVYLVQLPKQRTFSGLVRKSGINKAKELKADIITYLDTDDYLEPEHLSNIAKTFNRTKADWIYYNDKLDKEKRSVKLERSKIGTSNISHRAHVPINWGNGYCHDWRAIESILSYKSQKAEFSTYVVCHIPNQLDV